MPVIHRVALVHYTPEQMYDLVDDIASYHEFVPACVNSRVLEANDDEVKAVLGFSKGGIQKSFTTLNRLQKNKMIEIRLVDGPFHTLEGFWRFESKSDGQHCQVILDLEFELSSRLLKMVFGPMFHQIASALVQAFADRAKEVYAT